MSAKFDQGGFIISITLFILLEQVEQLVQVGVNVLVVELLPDVTTAHALLTQAQYF
jgi:hypothetical protein